MAITFVTTDMTNGFYVAAADDTLDVLPTGIVTAASNAVTSAYACQIEILGTVAGGGVGSGVGVYDYATASSGAIIDLYVGASGSVSGANGYDAVGVDCNFVFENHGAIYSSGAYSDGLYLQGDGSIVNYGSISATGHAIVSDAPNSDVWTVSNYGDITGPYAFYGNQESDAILNAGVMNGEIMLGAGAGGSLVNLGTINGAIVAPSGFAIQDSGVINGGVQMSHGSVSLSGAQVSVQGSDDAISFVTGTDAVRISGGWNSVTGAGGDVYETNALTSVLGGSDTVYFTAGTSNQLSLYDTMENWDVVYGSGGTIYETVAQASILGGSDTVDFTGGAGSQASLYNTNNAWDAVNGSDGTLMLTSAQASVTGGADTIYFSNGANNQASLYATAGNWDTVNGSNGTVLLTSAQTSLLGGGDTVYFAGGSSNQISLYDTNGSADAVQGANGVIVLTDAQATLTGNGDTLDFAPAGGGAVTLVGTGETLSFKPSVGATQVSGFSASTDQVYLSASQFGATWGAFFSGDVSQSGGNTLVTDPSNHANQITLVGVLDTSLVQANFHFV